MKKCPDLSFSLCRNKFFVIDDGDVCYSFYDSIILLNLFACDACHCTKLNQSELNCLGIGLQCFFSDVRS